MTENDNVQLILLKEAIEKLVIYLIKNSKDEETRSSLEETFSFDGFDSQVFKITPKNNESIELLEIITHMNQDFRGLVKGYQFSHLLKVALKDGKNND